MSVEQDGELKKLRIEDVSDSTIFYEVLFNPENYSENIEIEWNDDQGEGTSGTELKFKRIKPREYTLKMIFDSTGMSKAIAGASLGSVKDQIDKFKKVALDYKGDEHMPPEVKLVWGTSLFQGRLTKFDVTYELFKADGTPVRAKGTATFKSTIADELRAREENKSSPDLTHVRTVQRGDTLPLMCYRIYGDSAYYLKVAEVNALDDFRNLKPGQKIFFPPLAKTIT